MRYERFPECCAAAISCGFWAPNGRLYRFKEIDDFLKTNEKTEAMNSIRMSIVILHQAQYDAYMPVFKEHGYKLLDSTKGNVGAMIYLLLKKTRDVKPKV